MYIYINLTIFILLATMIVLSFKLNDERYLKPFRYVMIFLSIWTASSTLELIFNSYHLKLMVINITQFAMAFTSICNYWFVISYAGFERKIHLIVLKFFLLLNSIAIILLITDPIHHLLRSEVYSVNNNGILKLVITPTNLGYFFITIRFLLVVYAILLLIVFFFKTSKQMRKQVLIILIGFFLGLVLISIEQLIFVYHGTIIPMSTALILPYIIIAIGVFRYDFLSVSPIANEWIIDSLIDGIIVLAKNGKIIECNSSAREFLNRYESKVDFKSIITNNSLSNDSSEKISLESNNGINYYEISIHRLITENNIFRGSVVIIRDITVQTIQNQELIKKADLDGLTNVYNKVALERQFDMITNSPISLLIIDIDHFKDVNDTFGHPVGDIVLLGVVEAMKKSIRNQDLIGRIGGDEFCVILTDCTYDLCLSVCDTILKNVNNHIYNTSVNLPLIAVSIGALTDIHVLDTSFKEIYVKADLALYEAKKEGKNRLVIKKESDN